jgi:aryl-phospho-beta-D-glucosidase BglC (GH1 family)
MKRLLLALLIVGLLILSSYGNATDQPTPTAVPLPLLSVQGNKIVDQAGKSIVLKGLNICYPSIVKNDGHWTEDYFKQLASWGTKLVRVPIDPGSYRQMGQKGAFELLDQAVDWSKKYGMYVMVDWHSIGNPISGIFQDPWADELKTTDAEMKEFWGAVADRYKGEPAVAFYEVFNEPAGLEYKGGHMTWAQWRDMADGIIDVIYAHNPKAIPVVGGINWAYDLKGAGAEPLRNKGVVYACHPYSGHAGEPWEESWERDFGYLAKIHPVMLTEFGFDPHDTILPSVYKADTNYGKRILDFAKARGMSWTAFVFYNGSGWPMPLFKDWNYTPTESGAFFKEMLKK